MSATVPAPTSLVTGPADLCAEIGPLAREMVPGWRVTCEWGEPGEALAVCYPDELRQMCRIVVSPHPDGEDIGESIAHELAHAALRPLVALVDQSPASIQIEETIVERLGCLIARLWRTAPARARAIISALRSDVSLIASARSRTKILALASRRARGDSMDPIDLILAAVEAATAAADPKEALAALLAKVREIKEGRASEPADGERDEAASERSEALAARDPLAAPQQQGPMRARDEHARARRAADEAEAITASLRQDAKHALITSLRARLGGDHKGLPATEKDIIAAPTYPAAKQIHDLAIRFAPAPAETDPARESDGRLTAEPRLRKTQTYSPPAEKFDEAFVQMHRAVWENEGAEAAEKMLIHARNRLARDAAQGRTK
jgi:hypothetical protein